MSKTRHILLAFRLAYSSNRNFLAGIARYLKRAHNWHATIAENFYDFTDSTLQSTVKGIYDGIITVPPHDPKSIDLLASISKPTVIIGSSMPNLSPSRKRITFIKCDDKAIGQQAARHFMSLGTFQSFAFVMPRQVTSWATNRLDGFRDTLAKHGKEVYMLNSLYEDGSLEDIAYLRDALSRMPKPVAVMAAFDQRGTHVLQACATSADLSIPDRVQVISVDNDPIFCDFTRPSLTSISMCQTRMGEVAAIELARLMETPNATRKTVTLKNAEIVERESTAPISPASHLIKRTMEYIVRHATTGILPRDVTEHIGVSHALISKRFRDLGYGTMSSTIARAKLRAVRVKLRTTKLKISAITASCGFANADYAKRLFKKTYGVTMREYRNLGASPQRNS